MASLDINKFLGGKPAKSTPPPVTTQQDPALDGFAMAIPSLKSIGQSAKDVAIGAGKGLIDSSIQTARMLQGGGQRVLAGIDPTKTVEDVQATTGFKSFTGNEAEQIDEQLKSTNTDQKVGKVLELGAELLTPGGARKAVTSTVDNVSGLVDDVSEGFNKIKGNLDATGVKQKLIEFVAPEADDATKSIIKRSTPEEIDNFVKIQEEASKNTEALTPYEKIGDTMADATRQLESQRKSLGQQKTAIISKAKNGLEEFSKPTRDAILSITKSLKDEPIANTFITKLKTVKNKMGADKVIDELQDILYTGNKNLTIPSGSAVDKQLKGILGKYNTALKESLPVAYRNLNTKISNRIEVISSLNKALGEVVDGVSTRGGSLVKQFFSPNGRKAKELFEYVKKNTGVDLAKDATLARYVMELFGDARAKTLLGGDIPTSISGVTNKLIDFAVDKTGLGKTMQEAQRKGAIDKAKKLIQQK